MKRSLLMCCLALLALQGCAQQQPHSVTYQVTGFFRDQTANLTYTNADGSSVQENDVQLPHAESFRTNACSLYLSAQNTDDDGQSLISIKIIVDGTTVKQATSRGAYVIATASADICS